MTDRERLIQLIKNIKNKFEEWCLECEKDKYLSHEPFEDFLANELLANGVIVPTVKVGQTVYVPSGDEGGDWIDEYKVKYFYCSSKGINRYYIECGTMGNNFRPKDIGKTVFLTEEEAEEKLKELNNNVNL